MVAQDAKLAKEDFPAAGLTAADKLASAYRLMKAHYHRRQASGAFLLPSTRQKKTSSLRPSRLGGSMLFLFNPKFLEPPAPDWLPFIPFS